MGGQVWRVKIIFSFLLIAGSGKCGKAEENVESFFKNFNKELLEYNRRISEMAWESMLQPSNVEIQVKLEDFAGKKLQFVNRMCEHMVEIKNLLDKNQKRIYHLTCVGPKFESEFDERKFLEISSMMQYIYTTTKICVPDSFDVCENVAKIWNLTYVQGVDGLKKISFSNKNEIELIDVTNSDELTLKCFSGEPQLEKIMDDEFSILNSNSESTCKNQKSSIDSWIWEVWRQAIGPNIRELYPQLIAIQNRGAILGGFSDTAALWQKEMEIDNVENLMLKLLNEIQPFYNMLHAFVKSILEKQFSFKSKFLPAHILGWNANWHHLLDYIDLDGWRVDEKLSARQWSSSDVVKRVEDFYTSMGLEKLSKDFWDRSYIEDTNDMNCHGTAANMYSENDFRVIVCGFKRLYDLYVITHEIGHIQQYMLSKHQPSPFQSGNSVIQETIGDSFFLGLMTPMHLNRLRLIDDSKLLPSSDNNFDLQLLMNMALMKVPELTNAFVLETFRYNLLSERIDMKNSNDFFWELTRRFQRIEQPNVEINRHRLFDASAKFHFAANVPYAKYFFANVLQYQIFRGMCEVTLYGKVGGNLTLNMPLHKCDVYGSRRAGKLLKKSLQNGSGWNFQAILKSLTGTTEISADALLEYYAPLIKWLQNYLHDHKIEY